MPLLRTTSSIFRLPQAVRHGSAFAILSALLCSTVFAACVQEAVPDPVKAPELPAPAATAEPADTPEPSAITSSHPATPGPPATPETAPTTTMLKAMVAPTPQSTPLSLAGQTPPTATPKPTATPVLPTPISEDARAKLLSELDAEYRARCLHEMRRDKDAVTYLEFRDLDPDSMTDLERILWREELGTGDLMRWCRDYWAEPLSNKNAHKRNELYRPTVNQFARIANWLDIPGDDLLNMDPRPLDLAQAAWREFGLNKSGATLNLTSEWFGLFHISYHQDLGDFRGAWPRLSHIQRINPDLYMGSNSFTDSCAAYYPQLFTGWWIPLETPVGRQEIQRERQKATPTPMPYRMTSWINQRDRPMYIGP